MKKRTMFPVLVVLLLLWPISSWAGFIDPYEQGLLDPVSFYVVDDPVSSNPGLVSLTTSSFNVPVGFEIEYLYAGVSDWTTLQFSTMFTTAVNGREEVFLRLLNTNTAVEDTSGLLTFQGYQADDLFTTLLIDWGTMNLTIITAAYNDNLASVPLPGAVWLLASGFLGLLGIRKKAEKSRLQQ